MEGWLKAVQGRQQETDTVCGCLSGCVSPTLSPTHSPWCVKKVFTLCQPEARTTYEDGQRGEAARWAAEGGGLDKWTTQ